MFLHPHLKWCILHRNNSGLHFVNNMSLLGENDLSLDTQTSVFCFDMSVCKERKNNLCNLVERASAAS
jgi:hypothetical protein